MSRTDLRRLLLIGAAALVLRLGAAAVTERHPLFPDFYYTDARLIDAGAAAAAEAARDGRPFSYDGTLSQRVQVRIQSGLYAVVGIHPLAMKLVNCALGALAVVAVGAAAFSCVGPGPALAAAAFCAVWPSDVFYTSQNFKEAPTNLLATAGLAGLLAAMTLEGEQWGAAAGLGAASGLALLGAGFYRSYVMLAACAAALVACAAAAIGRRRITRSAGAVLAAAALVPAAYLPLTRAATTHWLGGSLTGDPRDLPQIIPVAYNDATTRSLLPTSPQALREYRFIRLSADRAWAKTQMHREIGTQIFPDARFETWLDVLAFWPKSAFYVLFMPLPGLYPMDGKLGRVLAAAENLVLLALAVLGLASAARGPKTPARLGLLAFFAIMTAGSALVEFDLGSAGRHKILYLPMLFPFAAEEIARLLRSSRSRPIPSS